MTKPAMPTTTNVLPGQKSCFTKVASVTGNFGSSGPGLHATNLRILDWLPENRIKDIPLSTTLEDDLNLAALYRPECHGPLAVQIELPSSERLVVELRENKYWDQAFGTTAVYIRFEKEERTFLQSNAPIGPRQGPQWITGETFVGFGVEIKILSISPSKGTARIRVRRI